MRRIDRVNSLLREVISDIIRKEVKNPHITTEMISVTHVDVTRDLRYAKVYISIIGDEKVKEQTMKGLELSAGFIAVKSAKEVNLRYFPSLTFCLDDTVEKQHRIDTLLNEIEQKSPKEKSSE